jgi:hypothetical protein
MGRVTGVLHIQQVETPVKCAKAPSSLCADFTDVAYYYYYYY